MSETQTSSGSPEQPDAAARRTRLLLRLLESSPDGFVVCSFEGRILSANRAFLDFVQVAAEEQIRGRSLDKWLIRRDIDPVGVVRDHGAVRLLAATLLGELGATCEVEISGVALADADPPALGLAIRTFERRLPGSTHLMREFPRSAEQLTKLVGQAPLREIVREMTDLVERLCIEAALQATHDNRASAAEILGLSRQSLYAKLHRYGLGYLDTTSVA